MSFRTRSMLVPAITLALAATGCTDSGARSGAPDQAVAGVRANASPDAARAKAPAEATVMLTGATAQALAIAASGALFDHAPLVLLAAAGDAALQSDAAPVAARLGVPMLLTPAPAPDAPAPDAPAADAPDSDALVRELDRLDATTILTFGPAAGQWAEQSGGDREIVAAPAAASGVVGAAPAGTDSAAPGPLTGKDLTKASAELGLPAMSVTESSGDVLVLASPAETDVAATATARAAGASVHVLAVADPRADSAVIARLSDQPPRAVVALGAAFGAPEQLRRRINSASTGVELPGGGQLVFPNRRLVALYGSPEGPSLGVLGEQPLEATLARAKKIAADYAPLSDVPVVPALEIITTVASEAAGGDGDYSSEDSVEDLRPWVEQAGAAGVYVVLDLQPGRSDFLSQAKRYAELLAFPHVGLALDPEWRLRPGQRHMAQIGSVGVNEVNQVVNWLAELTRERKLPQKVFILHQFRLSMITDRASLDMSHDELAMLIHVDGNGSQPQKQSTWRTLTASPPAGSWLGWKNFYDEDSPTLTPAETMAVTPTPSFISYQ